MCSQVTCAICGKPTWSGCGDHIEQALRGVPPEARCQGHTAPPVEQPTAAGERSLSSRPTGAG